MIDEQHDVLSVLAQRLEMYYTFLPTIGDLYGNAVLSRYPMEVTKRVAYAPGPTMRNQPRGALFVRIGDLLVVGTHLDHNSDGTFVRQDQVRTILREIGDATAVVVAGDLNAEPELHRDPALRSSGLHRPGTAGGADERSAKSHRSGSTTSGDAAWSARRRTRRRKTICRRTTAASS